MQDIRICFIGDSFVNGTGDREKLGWIGRVAERAESDLREITYYNLGVRRDTSSDILRRFEQETKQRFSEDADNRLLLSCGVNDIVMIDGKQRVSYAQSVKNLETMLRGAKRVYDHILMVGPPPIDDAEANVRIAELDAMFLEVCQAQDIPYLSICYRLMQEPVWLREVASNDGAHPRSGGYTLLADMVCDWDQWWFYESGQG
ncbi:MAG: lipase [Epsilonproteobacteria bacterium]|nr:lipase [Campylobacterota bacterium]